MLEGPGAGVGVGAGAHSRSLTIQTSKLLAITVATYTTNPTDVVSRRVTGTVAIEKGKSK